MNRLNKVLVGLVLLVAFSACEYTDIVPEDSSSVVVSEVVSFSTDVEPIFQAQSCTNCHPGMKQPDLKEGKAYQSLISGGFVNTSSPEDSKIYTEPSPSGGHAAKYTTAQAAIVLAWIEQGANDN